jgi:signal transduction histidine kinase
MKRQSPLSVRSKILLTIFLSVIGLSIAVYFISTYVLLGSYEKIEEAGVVQNLGRAHDTFDNFAHQQQIKVNDWSVWDDAYDYAKTHDEGWFERTAFAAGMANADVSSVIFTNNADVIYRLRKINIEERTEISSSSEVAFFVAHKELLDVPEMESFHTGLIIVDGEPSMFSSLPILKGDGTGPIRGSLAFTRVLDEQKIKDFADFIHLNLTAYVYDSQNLPPDVAEAKKHLVAATDHYVTPVSADTIVGYGLYTDIFGNPGLILRVEETRPIYVQGIDTIYIFLGIAGISLILFGIAMVWLLERLVIARFVRLTKDVEKINEHQDLGVHLDGGAMDEIGKLSGRINQMLSWLSASREAEAKSKKEIVSLLEDVKHGKERAEEMVVARTHELAQEKARLIASINSLAFGFVIADANDTVLLRNPALSSILEMEEIPTTTADVAKNLQKNGDTLNFDLLAFCHTSLEQKERREEKEVAFGKKTLRFLCAPVFNEVDTASVDEVLGYVLVVQDITTEKNMERSREEFFSIASHELRTPLTAIRGNISMLATMLKGKKKDKDVDEMLSDVDVSSVRLIAIVNDFLQVSRLEQGKIQFKEEQINIVEKVDSAARSMKELIEEKGLKLKITKPKEALPLALGDGDKLEQVLSNLLGNATKFTQKGSITITFDTVGPYVRVHVSDTGAGISPQNQTRLFKKFQQAGENMLARDVSQSTGLGLYISKLLIEGMGGSISLETSELGKGSTFGFSLRKA